MFLHQDLKKGLRKHLEYALDSKASPDFTRKAGLSYFFIKDLKVEIENEEELRLELNNYFIREELPNHFYENVYETIVLINNYLNKQINILS